MTEQQENAIYGAYMGICVLQTMCRKIKLDLAVQRCDALLLELSTAFPTVYERILLSPLRGATASGTKDVPQ
jgi:hypothetical protein